MIISTKGRYALRVMIDLATHADGGFVSLSDVARRQGISLKYLEAIAGKLNKAELIESKRGKDGGYRLAVPAGALSVGTVLKHVEGDLAPVSCLRGRESRCEYAESCPTLPLWKGLDHLIFEYLDRVTIGNLLDGLEAGGEPAI